MKLKAPPRPLWSEHSISISEISIWDEFALQAKEWRSTIWLLLLLLFYASVRLISYVPLRFPCLAVSPSSSGLAVAESVRPRWSQSVGRTTKPTWTPASWSRRTAGPGVWAASPRNTTDPAARSGGRRRGTTSINNAASFLLPVTMLHCGNITSSVLGENVAVEYWVVDIDCWRTKMRTKRMITNNQVHIYIDP